MSDKLILRHDADGVCTLTLNRPERRNAINAEMFKQFRRELRDIEKNGSHIGCIVIRANGNAFCAGHDLKDAPSNDALGWLRLELLTLEKLTGLPQPVICAVQGQCFTGGLELALTADMIVCTESAQFADTHGKWGLVPGWGMSQRLPRRVGQAKALEMMLTCRPYSGRQAEQMGLANICVPDDQLDAAIADLTGAILSNSWHSNAANKKLVYETDGMSIHDGIVHEVFRNEGFAPDFAERMRRFAEKKF
jgi:enoyl-CoA hydratase/carnithine racemase